MRLAGAAEAIATTECVMSLRIGHSSVLPDWRTVVIVVSAVIGIETVTASAVIGTGT
jgi:hypothetical protein